MGPQVGQELQAQPATPSRVNLFNRIRHFDNEVDSDGTGTLCGCGVCPGL